MNTLFRTLPVPALLAITAPAAADITAAEIWEDWQGSLAEMAMEVSGDVATQGDGLVIRNFTMSQSQPTGNVVQTVDEIRMIESSEGSVEITLSSPFRMTVDIIDAGVRQGTIEFLASYENLLIEAAGSIDNLTYTYSAESISMEEGAITALTDDAPQIDMSMTIPGMEGTYTRMENADGTGSIEAVSSVDGLAMSMDIIAPPSEAGRLKFSMTMGPMTSDGIGSLTALRALMIANTPGAELPELGVGENISGDVTYEQLSYDFQFDEPSASVQATGSNDGGSLAFSFGESGLSYDLSGRGMQLAAQGSEIPFPISAAAESTRFAITIPVVAAPEPSGMELIVDYTGLTVNEAIWAMFDPSGAIPRDPATLRVGMTGTVQLFTDLLAMDPATMTGPPGELRSVNLDTLLVSAAGAELTGNGAVTFAPGQLIPQPVGSVNLAMSGLNGLLDRLSGAGLLPLEQAGMVRAMAGMFARPGAGPDQIETTIDFLPGGAITANGIPLQ